MKKKGILFMSRHLTKTTAFKPWLCLEHPKIPNKPRLLRRGKRKDFLIIIIIFLVLLVGGVYFLIKYGGETNKEGECNLDSDCVPAGCCHSTSCTTAEKEPNCRGIYCTQECAPRTLDCGQGSCKCVNKKCEAILK